MANSETPTVRIAMFKKSEIETKIDEEINVLLDALRTCKNPEEYDEWQKQLTAMHALREKNNISKEALLSAAVNIAGIIVILSHERTHVIASKAFGLVKKIF